MTEKVAFNIASEASNVYILSGQMLIKMPKKSILASFWNSEAYGQTVLPDKSLLIGKKLEENAKIEILKYGVIFNLICDLLNNFQILCTVFEIVLKGLIFS